MALDLTIGERGDAIRQMRVDGEKRDGIGAIDFVECINPAMLVRVTERRGVIVASASMKPSISCGIEMAPLKYHLRSRTFASCLHAVVLPELASPERKMLT